MPLLGKRGAMRMLARLLLLGLILAGASPAAAQEPFPALVVNAVELSGDGAIGRASCRERVSECV